MNAEQKRAWLGVVSGVACIMLYVALIPSLGARTATVAFALFAINGFAGMIGKKAKLDERDKAITRHATLGGFAVSYGVFILGCMGTWAAVTKWQINEAAAIDFLPTIACLGLFAMYFVRCATILVLYGRHVEPDNA